MKKLDTKFIFVEFQKHQLEPREGLTLLIEALCMALGGASEREDLERNLHTTVVALQEGTRLYYDAICGIKERLNDDEEFKKIMEAMIDEDKTQETQ